MGEKEVCGSGRRPKQQNQHSPKYPLPLDDLLGGGLGGPEQRVGQRRVPLRPPQHFGRDGGMMMTGRRRGALVADRRSGRGGRRTRAGGGGWLRMGHEQRGVLHALHVPDPRRRGGRGGRRRVGRLVHAQRGAPAPASLVPGPGAPQRAHPAVRPAVPISAARRPAPSHAADRPDADRRWHAAEHAASRYTGPGLHFHEAGFIAAPGCVRLLLHLEEARRGQLVMMLRLLLMLRLMVGCAVRYLVLVQLLLLLLLRMVVYHGTSGGVTLLLLLVVVVRGRVVVVLVVLLMKVVVVVTGYRRWRLVQSLG